ncbi:hypothetical protein L345_08916, partial [Ophiophagus hannah]
RPAASHRAQPARRLRLLFGCRGEAAPSAALGEEGSLGGGERLPAPGGEERKEAENQLIAWDGLGIPAPGWTRRPPRSLPVL